jgi:hypothetical protein
MKTTTIAKTALGIGAALLVLTVAPGTMAYASPAVHVPCSGSGGGSAGLIAAINNANSSGGGTINLAEECTYALTAVDNTNLMTGANGLPVVTSRITIKGDRTTIARKGHGPTPPSPFRIFEVDGPVGNLTLQGLTISGGTNPFGGGILNAYGAVTLNHSQVTGNTADAVGIPGGGGGGVLNFAGTLTLNDSQVNGNSSPNGGGIASGNGGAPGSSSTLILNNSQVNRNTASGGTHGAGGIANGGIAVLNRSEVNNNAAPGLFGGGIVNHGTMTINESQVKGNSAPGGGGGGIINLNVGAPNSGVLTINNSQVNGNSAPGGIGGGILNDIPGLGLPPATLALDHSQVTHNTSASGGGIYNNAGSSVTLKHTFVGKNHPDNCFPDGSIPGCDD